MMFKLEYLAVYGRTSMGESVKPAVLPENVGQSSPKFFWRMLLHKTPNLAKICGNRWKDAGNIHNQIFVLPEKVDQSSPIFRGTTP